MAKHISTHRVLRGDRAGFTSDTSLQAQSMLDDGEDAKGDVAGDILLVDDDIDFIHELSEGLKIQGYNNFVAASPHEALQAFNENPSIDLVITDLDLPFMSGIELLKKFSLWSRNRMFSSVIITANASIDLAVSAIRCNVKDLLQKPVSIHEVLATVERIRAADERRIASPLTVQAIRYDRLLRSLLGIRVERDNIFGAAGGISDIAWQLLLEIALATEEEKTISVTSACIATGVSVTTALRHQDEIERMGFVVRLPDTKDGRRTLLKLSSSGQQRIRMFMDRYSKRIPVAG